MQKLLTAIALKSIKLYQTYISPYKGFSCAHRVSTNETSCSVYGARVIKRYGLFTGYKLLNRRFYDCSWHAKKIKTSYLLRNSRNRYQRGLIDCDCSPDCDYIPDCGNIFDLPDSCKDKKQNHSNEFTTKRDKKNNKKYNTPHHINSSKHQGVVLNKKN